MKAKKLSLSDFEEVKAEVLLESKGGCGAKAGDPDGFGGYYSMDEVTVTGSWEANCLACSDAASPRPVWGRGWGTLLRDLFMHRDGCPNGL